MLTDIRKAGTRLAVESLAILLHHHAVVRSPRCGVTVADGEPWQREIDGAEGLRPPLPLSKSVSEFGRWSILAIRDHRRVVRHIDVERINSFRLNRILDFADVLLIKAPKQIERSSEVHAMIDIDGVEGFIIVID